MSIRASLVCLAAAAAACDAQAPWPVERGMHLHRVADKLGGDVRLVVMGDSFAVPLDIRVFPEILREWRYGPITAVAAGAAGSNTLVSTQNYASPVEDVDAVNGYNLMRFTQFWEYFALPVRGIKEIRFEGSTQWGADGSLLSMQLDTGVLDDGDGAMIFRPLYWSPADIGAMVPTIQVRDLTTVLGSFELRSGARGTGTAVGSQINAPADDIQLDAGVAGSGRLRLALPDAADPGGEFFQSAGAVFAQADELGQRVPGLYYSYLADNSWSFLGFGEDEGAIHARDKTFSVEQLSRWLAATTIDPAQPIVAVYYLAMEGIGYPEASVNFPMMVDKTSAAAAAAGVGPVTHLFVLPHGHQVSGLSYEQAQDRFGHQRRAAYDLARSRPDVAVASMYDALETLRMDGSPAALAWLAENGGDAFEWDGRTHDLTGDPWLGNLLDFYLKHPLDQVSAAFFAKVLMDHLDENRCGIDLAEPMGVIDFFDVSLFLDLYGQGDLAVDLTGDQLLDFWDVIDLLDRMAAGCP